MNGNNRDDYFNWNEAGETEFLETQCEECKHQRANPLVCTKYPNGKPIEVRMVTEACPKFEKKGEKRGIWEKVCRIFGQIARIK